MSRDVLVGRQTTLTPRLRLRHNADTSEFFAPSEYRKQHYLLSTSGSRSFPYRLAAIDLDDTLLSPDKSISPQNEAAIRSLQERGVMIVLASGLRHENMLKYHRIL